MQKIEIARVHCTCCGMRGHLPQIVQVARRHSRQIRFSSG